MQEKARVIELEKIMPLDTGGCDWCNTQLRCQGMLLFAVERAPDRTPKTCPIGRELTVEISVDGILVSFPIYKMEGLT